MTDVPAAHIIVDQFYLYALTRLVDQGIRKQHAQRVFGKDIHIDMDMTFGLRNLCQKCGKEGIAIVVDRDLIILERK